MYTTTPQQSTFPMFGFDGTSGGGQFGGFLLGALLARNGGLFGGNGDVAAASVASDANEARFAGLTAQMANLSQQLQNSTLSESFNDLSAQNSALTASIQNQISQIQLASCNQANAMQAALAACCCENRVATEQVKTAIALTQASLDRTICDQAHDTENLINAQTAQLTQLITNNLVSNLQDQISESRTNALQSQLQSGFNAILLAMQNLNGNGNGNGK